MSAITLYHNPRCSKSRQTLALLHEKGHDPKIIEYLKTPPSPADLHHLLTLLKAEPRDIIRSSEPEYQANGLQDSSLSDEQLISAIADHPKLLQRPIVVINNTKAAIGRPPENILQIL